MRHCYRLGVQCSTCQNGRQPHCTPLLLCHVHSCHVHNFYVHTCILATCMLATCMVATCRILNLTMCIAIACHLQLCLIPSHPVSHLFLCVHSGNVLLQYCTYTLAHRCATFYCNSYRCCTLACDVTTFYRTLVK